jgi:hypothetical protein
MSRHSPGAMPADTCRDGREHGGRSDARFILAGRGYRRAGSRGNSLQFVKSVQSPAKRAKPPQIRIHWSKLAATERTDRKEFIPVFFVFFRGKSSRCSTNLPPPARDGAPRLHCPTSIHFTGRAGEFWRRDADLVTFASRFVARDADIVAFASRLVT